MDRHEILLEVAKLAEESVAHRQTYEWQVNIAVWGAVLAIASKLIGEPIASSMWAFLLIAYVFGFAIYCQWTWMVQNGHSVDRIVKSSALRRVQSAIRLTTPETCKCGRKTGNIVPIEVEIQKLNVPRVCWSRVFIALTALLMFGSLFFIWLSQPKEDSPKKFHLDLRYSQIETSPE